MTRHGMVQTSATGTQPPATDPRASMVIIDTNTAASGGTSTRQYRAVGRRDGLSASIQGLPGSGHAIPDTGRKPKSP